MLASESGLVVGATTRLPVPAGKAPPPRHTQRQQLQGNAAQETGSPERDLGSPSEAAGARQLLQDRRRVQGPPAARFLIAPALAAAVFTGASTGAETATATATDAAAPDAHAVHAPSQDGRGNEAAAPTQKNGSGGAADGHATSSAAEGTAAGADATAPMTAPPTTATSTAAAAGVATDAGTPGPEPVEAAPAPGGEQPPVGRIGSVFDRPGFYLQLVTLLARHNVTEESLAAVHDVVLVRAVAEAVLGVARDAGAEVLAEAPAEAPTPASGGEAAETGADNGEEGGTEGGEEGGEEGGAGVMLPVGEFLRVLPTSAWWVSEAGQEAPVDPAQHHAAAAAAAAATGDELATGPSSGADANTDASAGADVDAEGKAGNAGYATPNHANPTAVTHGRGAAATPLSAPTHVAPSTRKRTSSSAAQWV